MKNRTRICYALDIVGLLALIGAGFALFSALWFAASPVESEFLSAFKYGLMTAVSAFMLARAFEINHLLRAAASTVESAPAQLPSNVEALPERRALPRAA